MTEVSSTNVSEGKASDATPHIDAQGGKMTREKAIQRLRVTPKYKRAPCPWCKATTLSEARTKCRPVSDPCGEYYCGTPEEAPTYFGFLHQTNPKYMELDGYLWGWYAFDEGMTDQEPVWEETSND